MTCKAAVTRPAAEHTLKSLADQLRDGPLQSLAALQAAAVAIAGDIVAGKRDAVAQASDLVLLAQAATAQFQEFTSSLRKLVDELAARARDAH